MLARTILHHLLPEFPDLFHRLKEERLLLAAMEHFARELHQRQYHWLVTLASQPDPRDPVSQASEARDLAVHELRERLSLSEPDVLLAEVKASVTQPE